MSEPADPIAPLKSGASLGSYTIIGRLGAGGMGEVYRARDTKLERDVAIKVLLPAVVTNAERLARFQREARVLAALNHPRIAAIYGLDDSGSSPALVMELVEGPTLSDRLTAGALAVDECIRVARQIAEGLEYAHEQGIVHRDLKPANVKVAADDSVKILDFGLAKAVERDSGPNVVNSPTATWMATQAGVLLGTASYMAPEQAKGKAADRRADNWAFGCVLYEMLTATQAFHGETVADILASVMRAEPDWSRLPESTPPGLRDLVRRCLRKDVRERLQAIGDARIALDEIARGPIESGAPIAIAPAPPRGGWLMPSLAGLTLGTVVAGLAAWTLLRAPVAPKEVTRFTITLPPGESLASSGATLALSEDGRQLAYLATKGSEARQLYLRPMDRAEATALPGTDNATAAFFSPDGQWLGFFADGKLKKVAVGGGVPQTLADVTNSFGAAWTRDHTIAFVPLGSAIQQIADDGGEAVRLTTMLPGEVMHAAPERLPDGGVLFGAATAKDLFIAAQPPGGGERKDFKGQFGMMPHYLASGHLVYAQNGTLMAVPFDARALEVSGTKPAIPVVKGIRQGRDGWAQFAASASGSLAYVQGQAEVPWTRLVWVSRTGAVDPLNIPVHIYYQPRVSPDGRYALSDVLDGGSIQVWMIDLARDSAAPFTFDASNRHGIWTRDSTHVIFLSSRDGTQRIFWQRADGNGQPEPLMKESRPASDGVFNIPYSVAADGTLSYVHLLPTKNAQFLALRLPQASATAAGAPAVTQFLESGAADGAPQLSPDGRWVAYASDESGRRREIFVRAFPGPGGPWRVSAEGGNEPQWNPNGRELFYRSGRKMMAVDVNTAGGFGAGKPHVLFEGDFEQTHLGYARANYDVSPDGQRFLMVQPTTPAEPPPSEITVVLNWSEELKRLVPVAF